jgi:hypothetical protein
MSAIPPKADMDQCGCDVRFVPKADRLLSMFLGAAIEKASEIYVRGATIPLLNPSL